MAFLLEPEGGDGMNGLHVNGQDSLVQPLLTDFYQVSMCYAYWRAKIHQEEAVFDLYFRKNPFQGEYTIFAGLEDCLRFVENFRFSESDIKYIRSVLPEETEDGFFEYLASIDCGAVQIEAIQEGTVVFPKIPLLIVSGPLAICQLLETTLLNLVNYASLVATNAARFRYAAGNDKQLLEFGLRRAQGPNGGLCASKYTYIGGFDGTSNVLAGKLFGIPVKGTQAHSFVCSFSGEEDLRIRNLSVNGKDVDLYQLSLDKLTFLMEKMTWGVARSELSQGELASFVAYAIAFPKGFLALIDTYDVLRSGVVNFLAVALALNDIGYRALGVRIDSGDLSYLSKEIRVRFRRCAALDSSLSFVSSLTIVASNDINEETIISLNEQQHSIDAYGVGTHLVTCQKQPALGCVYKLVEIAGHQKIKLSQDVSKITIPRKKVVHRLFSKNGDAILDLIMAEQGDNVWDEERPGGSVMCRHPFEEAKRCLVSRNCRRVKLHRVYWRDGKIMLKLPNLVEIKTHVNESLATIRPDIKRYLNPTPYKVSVSEFIFDSLHKFWLDNAPICQLE